MILWSLSITTVIEWLRRKLKDLQPKTRLVKRWFHHIWSVTYNAYQQFWVLTIYWFSECKLSTGPLLFVKLSIYLFVWTFISYSVTAAVFIFLSFIIFQYNAAWSNNLSRFQTTKFQPKILIKMNLNCGSIIEICYTTIFSRFISTTLTIIDFQLS